MTASCNPLCDATALYAAVMHQRGDVEETKLALLDLMALNPTYELDTKRYSRDFIALRVQVATGVNAALRGGATVKSRPAGARVYIDNEFKGYTPLTVSTLPVGKHLLRLERPGFRVYGQLLEVSPDDVEASAELQPTDDYKAYRRAAGLGGLRGDARQQPSSQAVAGAGQGARAGAGLRGHGERPAGHQHHRAGAGPVRHEDRQAAGRAARGAAGRRVRPAQVGDGPRLVNHLLNNAEGGAEKKVKASDPLENCHGMDEWNGEDQGGKRRSQEKKTKEGDPLEGVNGTEDW